MPQIHPLALVEKGAQLADDVIVGPYAYIGPEVVLGRGCVVHHHASIEGRTMAGPAGAKACRTTDGPVRTAPADDRALGPVT